MKIGLITPYFPDGKTQNSGIANHFDTLSKSLAELGNQVIIVHIRPKYEDEKDDFEELELSHSRILIIHKINASGFVKFLFRKQWSVIDFIQKLKTIFLATKYLRRIQKRYQLDIMETTSYLSITYLYELTRPRLPVVTRVSTTFLQMMDNYFTFNSRIYNLFGKIEISAIKNSDFLITHAKSHAEELEKLYRISSQSYFIIPHGIDLPPTKIPSDNNPLKILHVGRFEYRKGTDVLLEAIPFILSKNRNVTFELIGSDPEGMYEAKFLKENSELITAKVKFCGLVDNDTAQKAYSNCDIFVAPSRYESFGLIYIEAMGHGKPVVGTNIGGIPEIIKSDFNGLLVNINDPIDLADSINTLIENKALRRKLGENARLTVQDKFSKKTLALNTLNYYQEAIASRQTG